LSIGLVSSGVGYTIFNSEALAWEPRGDDSGRSIATLSDGLTKSRANLWRYPSGAVGRRHVEHEQEEVFVVLDGDAVMVIDGQDHPAPKGTFVRVAPSLMRTVRNDNEAPVTLLIVSAPTTSGYVDMGWA
jgi:mannose-6-phosphate isomerase-like protein (cupin superfamily)